MEEDEKPLFRTPVYSGNKDVDFRKSPKNGRYYANNLEVDLAKDTLEKDTTLKKLGLSIYKALYDAYKDKNWLLAEKNFNPDKEARRKKTLEASNENEVDIENSKNTTCDNYRGSYAQDIEDYSDQDIDDIFDGDPDMYWNID